MPRLVAIDADGMDFVDAMRRAWDAGDAVAPIDPRLPAAARDAVLRALRADEPVEDGDALVVATSGTSGEPKGVVLTHDAIAAMADASNAALGVTAHDSWWVCLPLAHIGGLSVVLRALRAATPFSFEDDDASLVSMVPTMLTRSDVSRFRRVLLGGAAAPGRLPTNVVRTYGMTETGSGVAYDGVALANVEIRVVEGQVHVRGPMLLRCYRDGVDPKDGDGWFATGDAGAITDGVLSVTGHIGDVINTGGEKVWPIAVEHALENTPGVRELAIAGRSDPEWGQCVVAFVVADGDPPTLDALRARVKETLPAYCAPKQLVLVETLPRTASGKVRRSELP